MGTELQDQAAAKARKALERKRESSGALATLLERLLNTVAAKSAGGTLEDRCLACVERDRHMPKHTCPCVCHEARRALDALR